MIDRFFDSGIEVHTLSTTKDARGANIKTYTKDRDIVGRMRMLKGNEQMSASKPTYFATHRLYTKDKNILQTDKIKHKNRMYEIRAINDVMYYERHWQIDLELIE